MSVERSAPKLLRILLLYGIVTAVVLLAIGLAAFLIDSDLEIEDGMTIESFFDGIRSISAVGILGIGILVIISTPLVRILATTVIFRREGDRLMVFLSISVLAIIVSGLLLGMA